MASIRNAHSRLKSDTQLSESEKNDYLAFNFGLHK